MTTSSSKQPENQPKTHDTEQPESPAKPTKATGASSKPLPVPEGVVLDNTPFQQIFVGGLPGKPPQK
jgi:hypothetical protein